MADVAESWLAEAGENQFRQIRQYRRQMPATARITKILDDGDHWRILTEGFGSLIVHKDARSALVGAVAGEVRIALDAAGFTEDIVSKATDAAIYAMRGEHPEFVDGWMAARNYYGGTVDEVEHGAECPRASNHTVRCACDEVSQFQRAKEARRG